MSVGWISDYTDFLSSFNVYLIHYKCSVEPNQTFTTCFEDFLEIKFKHFAGTYVMASSSTQFSTTTQDKKEEDKHTTLKLSLKKEKTTKIKWTEDTVDNEGSFHVAC